MKKKTKEILEILKGFMLNSELKNHMAEIVLYKKSDSHFTIASYISNILNNNEESSLYIGTEIDAKRIDESNPCLWLASLLDLDYEIIYVSLPFHCTIWANYFDVYNELEDYENRLNEYFCYCKQHDITADLLESFCGEEFEDIADQEFFEMINGHVIVERFAIKDCVFLFAHNELKETFAVYDSDKNYSTYTNEKIYHSYLEAFEDFQNRIKKYWYDELKKFNEQYYFYFGGDKEVEKILKNKN